MAAWVRLDSPSLPRMLLTWVRAVRSVMNSADAISLLDAPCPTEGQDLLLALRERLQGLWRGLRSRIRCASSRATAGSRMDLARVCRTDRNWRRRPRRRP